MSNTAGPGDEARDEARDDARGNDGHDEARRENQRRRRHSDERDGAKSETRGESAQLSATAESGPTFALPEPRMRDLSADLMQTLPRGSGQIVRCRRIVGDQYRCNWWGSRNASAHDNVGGSGVMITRYQVVKSRMLRATVTSAGVAIDADGVQ